MTTCLYCLIAGLVGAALMEAAERFIVYRDNNTLNFQLEKADDFINELRAAIARARGEA
jgi:hypothetical protein